MNDLALAAVLFSIASVPLGLLLLGASGAAARWPPVARLAGSWAGRVVLVLAALPGLYFLFRAVWAWSGAAHLQPLCIAYGRPERFVEAPVVADSILLDTPEADPPWARQLLGGADAFTSYERQAPGGLVRRVVGAGASPDAASQPFSTVVLVVRRELHHSNRWFRVERDRFELRRRADGERLAAGSEFWISAGDAQYRCGIASGPVPVRGEGYPQADGVLRFVRSVAVRSGA